MVRIRSRVNLQDLTFALVKPRDHDELVARLDAHQSGRDERIHVEPHIGCALGSLLRRFATERNIRADYADRPQGASGGMRLFHGHAMSLTETAVSRY